MECSAAAADPRNAVAAPAVHPEEPVSRNSNDSEPKDEAKPIHPAADSVTISRLVSSRS